MDRRQTSERRTHTRFKARAGAYTVFSPKSVIPGRINDISLGGLSFSYVEGEEWYQNAAELDILFGDDDFYLDRIPFETVSDTMIENESPYSQIVMRRCGVKFGTLSEAQLDKLRYFIRHNTVSGEEQELSF